MRMVITKMNPEERLINVSISCEGIYTLNMNHIGSHAIMGCAWYRLESCDDQRIKAEITHCEPCIPAVVQDITLEPLMTSIKVSEKDQFRVFGNIEGGLLEIDLRYCSVPMISLVTQYQKMNQFFASTLNGWSESCQGVSVIL